MKSTPHSEERDVTVALQCSLERSLDEMPVLKSSPSSDHMIFFFFHNRVVGAARRSSTNIIRVNIELHCILYPSPPKTEAALGICKSLQETRLTAGAEINSFHPPPAAEGTGPSAAQTMPRLCDSGF